jgi:predicted nucleic acid-binding protein
VYLDASVLVAFFTDDHFTLRADAFLDGYEDVLIISDFAAAEFASVIARQVRTKEFSAGSARDAFSSFDSWIARAAQPVEFGPLDVRTAEAFLRRLDLPLRTADAIHIAIARRIGASIATYDKKMAACARALGTAVVAA